MSKRFEASLVGRALVSVFVVATLLALVVWNMPDSALRRHGLRIARPYVNALGLDQNWAVFAPNPRQETLALEARITYADGSRTTWRTPVGGDLFGAYWDYHWLKWAEWTLDARYPQLLEPTAEFVLRQESGGGRTPTRIELVRRSRAIPAPGTEGSPPWRRSVILDRGVEQTGGLP